LPYVSDLAFGAYDHVVTLGLHHLLAEIDTDLVDRGELDPADSHEVLARHIRTVAESALRSIGGVGPERVRAQVELANRIVAGIVEATPRAVQTDDLLATPPELLAAIVPRPPAPQPVRFPDRPQIPLANGALLTNGRGQPSIGSEVNKELASANNVDLLCAFIKRRGVRLLRNATADLIARGGRLRIITTTYMGATEQQALDELARLGAEVRISYETRTTRLHAKAWLFHRDSGVSTAYVGSSNLSQSALVDGMEWNVRLSQLGQPAVLETFAATFEEYWNDPSFEPYDPDDDEDRKRLARALRVEARDGSSLDFTTVDVHPYPYQQEILEGLDSERLMHGRFRNLVVMATGTGKTVVAGLDYRRLRAGGVESLLFVAHQQRILEQSRSVFRHVLKDGTFGELFVGGHRPSDWRHVFASVQSLHRLDLDQLDPRQFDMVVVDEFHHAEAATYRKLLELLQPKVLLGLTATPERADGQDVRRWFAGHTAVELRLWEALERQLLSPFQYFGIHDDVDLHRLEWKRGRGYDIGQLEAAYNDNDARVGIILRAVDDAVDPQTMRALGFCVSIAHAEFMADRFRRAGIAAVALHANVSTDARDDAVSRLKSGELKILFTVDLFNEGVDLPTVDTILMLRPTESATIFLQQLGRGLRLSDEKPYLTVLDFIGAQHAQFRFDRRYRALTGITRRRLIDDVKEDFPSLPAGCHIELDRVAKQIVLDNIRQTLRLPRAGMVAEVRQLPDADLRTFLEETGFEIEDIYRRKGWRGWTGLREEAGLLPAGRTDDAAPDDAALSTAIGRLLHFDDPDRIAALREIADGGQPAGRLGEMMRQTLWGSPRNQQAGRELLAALPTRQEELRQVASVLEDRIERVSERLDPSGVNPLRLHARYTRNEICAAFGIADPSNVREGVKWLSEERADIFFVTLNKTEQHYSPTTMYADRAITETLFQWESQSTTRAGSETGQRYIHHAVRSSSVHLFLRESKEADGDLGAPPYLYAGRMAYVEHTGERPMRIVWRLDRPLPADVFHAARVAAA
jgi:superfamily II DNA or RNA helicase/HKD family nuclease